MNCRPWIKMAAVAAIASFVPLSTLLSHSGATGVVKERMMAMKSMGDSVKELAAMMRGETPYDAARVKALASEIASHAGDRITEKFPEGSTGEPSEAIPQIWQRWDAFVTLSERLEDYAGALQQAADNPRGVPAAGNMAAGNSMMMGQGMMGGGMMGGGMMQDGGPTPEHLATMPPRAAFMHVTQTCSSCHEQFRKKQP